MCLRDLVKRPKDVGPTFLILRELELFWCFLVNPGMDHHYVILFVIRSVGRSVSLFESNEIFQMFKKFAHVTVLRQ